MTLPLKTTRCVRERMEKRGEKIELEVAKGRNGQDFDKFLESTSGKVNQDPAKGLEQQHLMGLEWVSW
jgi:hypothetical protein